MWIGRQFRWLLESHFSQFVVLSYVFVEVPCYIKISHRSDAGMQSWQAVNNTILHAPSG
jgi:hypothetical protein